MHATEALGGRGTGSTERRDFVQRDPKKLGVRSWKLGVIYCQLSMQSDVSLQGDGQESHTRDCWSPKEGPFQSQNGTEPVPVWDCAVDN